MTHCTDSTPISLGAEAWLVELQRAPLDITPYCGDAITCGKRANDRPIAIDAILISAIAEITLQNLLKFEKTLPLVVAASRRCVAASRWAASR